MNQYNSGAEDTPPEDAPLGDGDRIGLPFPSAEVLSNQFPESLEFEIALAKEVGVEPALAGTSEFDQMVQDAEQNGEKLKWVVTHSSFA